MAEIRLSTTGTLSPVVIDDFGARSFTHPTTDFDLLAEFTEDEIKSSADLEALRAAGHITLSDENGNSITITSEASAHTHLAANIIDPVTLEKNVFLKARNETGSPIAIGLLVAAVGFSVSEGRTLVDIADKGDGAKRPAIGVATEIIANNSNTDLLLSVGILSGVDTSSLAINDQLVLGDAGGFLRPPPEVDPFTGEIQLVGSVTRVDASLGEIYVTCSAGLLPMTAAQFFAVRETSPSGGVSGGEVTRATGLNVDVAAGSGFINDANNTIRVVWTAVANLALTVSDTNFIFVDKNNLVQASISPPDIENNIVLADAITDGTTVVLLANHQVLLQELPAKRHDYSKEVIGNIVVNGLITSQATTALRVKVDLGTYFNRSFRSTVPGTDPITFTYWFRDGSGGFTRVAGSTLIDKDNWDDGTGVLNSLVATEWKKDLLFVVYTAAGLVEYHVFYGQEVFTSQSLAENGNLPAADGDVIANGIRSAGIIIEGAAAAIASFVDVRPFLGQLAPGVTAVSDHGLLSGLSDDDHTQYLLTSGSRAMGGGLDMGTNAITNVGTVDGRDVSVDGAKLDTIESGARVNPDVAEGGITVVSNISRVDFGLGFDVADGGSGEADVTLDFTEVTVEAPRTIDGVRNDGGDIDLVAGSNITITPNDGANTITIASTDTNTHVDVAESGSTVVADAARIDFGLGFDVADGGSGEADVTFDPSEVTVEAPMTIDGVRNDGGDIDLVAGSNVTITPNDGANTITITATHVDVAGGGSTVVADAARIDFGLGLSVADGGSGEVDVTLNLGAIPPPSSLNAFAFDTTTQTIAIADTFQDVTFNTNGTLNDWTHTPGASEFTCNTTGNYQISVLGTVEKNGGGNLTGALRCIIDAVEVPGSHFGMDITANNTSFVVARVFQATITATEVLEIQLAANSTNVSLLPGPNPGTATSVVSASISIIRVV